MRIKKRNWWLIGSLVTAIAFVLSFGIGGYMWYRHSLSPYNAGDTSVVRFAIKDGMSGSDIAKKLADNKLIHSSFAFSIYMRLNGSGMNFKTGVYKVSPSQPLSEIVKHLSSGKVDEYAITFYPEAMITTKVEDQTVQRRSVSGVLKHAGFSQGEITEALAARYDSPLFHGRPDDADLEGYIWGETYYVPSDYSARQVLQRAIDEFAAVVKKNDLEAKFAKKGLTLYQGITLASIVQKESKGCESASICEDQRQIASVFYNRLKANMPLGSDVTYHYAADKTGLARSHTLDSPYNSRIHKGLPPGPIATPGLSALHAVTDPAATDYLYFLSGDDNVTYFAKTNAEHQANIQRYCTKKCALP